MIGQYTTDELVSMEGIISSVEDFHNGLVKRLVGVTMNYYRQESDGSWTNYHCRTVERYIW
jgi:hypothetical protein